MAIETVKISDLGSICVNYGKFPKFADFRDCSTLIL